MNGKESWYTSALFILQQLHINANMSLDEIKSKLIKRSMELWGKQLHENAVIKEGKMKTFYRFKLIFKKEIYLNVIGNRDIRKGFTQFRVSAHDNILLNMKFYFHMLQTIALILETYRIKTNSCG